MNYLGYSFEGQWTVSAGSAVQNCYSDIRTECHIWAVHHRCPNQTKDLLLFCGLHGEPHFTSHVLVTFFSFLVSIPNLNSTSYDT